MRQSHGGHHSIQAHYTLHESHHPSISVIYARLDLVPKAQSKIRETSMGVTLALSGVRRKFSWGGFIQWHLVVICIWCALFVTSQFDVIFMFLNQRLREIF